MFVKIILSNKKALTMLELAVVIAILTVFSLGFYVYAGSKSEEAKTTKLISDYTTIKKNYKIQILNGNVPNELSEFSNISKNPFGGSYIYNKENQELILTEVPNGVKSKLIEERSYISQEGETLLLSLFGGYTTSEDRPLLEPTPEHYFIFDSATGTITGYSSLGPIDIVIPSKIGGVTVRRIGDYAFYKDPVAGLPGFGGLEPIEEEPKIDSVDIPNTITYIGVGAFAHNNINFINILSSVTQIREYAFEGNLLSRVIVENPTANIHNSAFNSSNLIICGHDPSTAKTLAINNYYTFINIQECDLP